MKNQDIRKGMFAVVASLLTIVLVAGIWAVGTPGDARTMKLDERRRGDINDLRYAITDMLYRSDTATLPETLDEVDTLYSESHKFDPQTGDPYTYRRLSDSQFELCATFALEYPSDNYAEVKFYGKGGYDEEMSHPAGEHCFKFEIKDEKTDYDRFVDAVIVE